MDLPHEFKGQQAGRRIYLDYAASTPIDHRVLEVIDMHLRETYGNAGGLHAEGQKARAVLEDSRARIARCIGAREDEIIFTGSGTESNNLAIFGTIAALEKDGIAYERMHFITSAIEHPSVLDCFHKIEERGARVSYVGVTSDGQVNPEEIRLALSEETVLVSIMYANNEMGAVQPIAQIAEFIQKHRGKSTRPVFHVDASQTPLFLPASVSLLNADLITYDAQKITGPKGVGALYRKKGVALAPVLIGGNQEFGLRPGTENVPTIAGFARAFELAIAGLEERSEHMRPLRDYFISELGRCVPHAVLNGHPTQRIANNVNISVPGMESEFMVIALDAHGVACGSKSACIRDRGEGSYVILALGKDMAHASSSLRFTLGPQVTRDELTFAAEALGGIVASFDKSTIS